MTLIAVLCLGIFVFPGQLQGQNGTDVCRAMVTDAAHSISLSTTSNAYYISIFKNYCNADGSANQTAIDASGSAIIDAIPVGLKGNFSDAKSQWSQFCSKEQSIAAGSSDTYDYQSLVVSQALTSANECLKILSDHAYLLTYKVMTADTMVVNFGIPSGQSIVIHGVKADSNVTCTGSDLTNGGSFTYKEGVGQTINASQGSTSVTCIRAPFTNVGSSPYYKEAAVEVDTNVGQLNIFWPKETVLPLTAASQIQKEIAALQSAVTFNALPIGTILPWFQKNGNPPAGWVKCDGSDTAHCPNLEGVFLRGSKATDVGSTGGNAKAEVGQHGSNNRRPDGNGWSIDGGHFLSNDRVFVDTIPPYNSVLYIMKVTNQ
jgi:hypothetical protein